MSKYNKVNPGIYTQRGRLTPDEAARELRKQRETSSARTAQPMSGRARTAPAPEPPKAEAPQTRTTKRMAGPAKAGTAKAPAIKRTKTTSTRKAVLARNAGGPGAAPRRTTTRRRG